MTDQFAADRILETAEEMEKALRQIKIHLHHAVKYFDVGKPLSAQFHTGAALEIIEKGPRLTTIITNTETLRVSHAKKL